ncbi:MAG: hybrid sensor histidine kinase/response regulator [Planctomycetota bacterium]
MPSVVLCEADEAFIHEITPFLEEAGYDLHCFSEGERAWDTIQELKPDVVITAHDVPGLSGLDLLALISTASLGIPVIFMTSVGTEQVAAEAINLGAANYLIKGSGSETLASLERALDKVFYQKWLEEENRRLLEKLRRHNVDLEQQVAERTADLEQAVDELRSLDQLKSDFVTLMSHEMRTPLTTILGFAELLSQRLYKDEEELHEVLGTIHSAGMRLSEFVSEALELFQWYSGRHPLVLTRVNVNEWVQRNIERVMAQAREKTVGVEAQSVDPDCTLEADGAALDQILQKILDNAIKFSHAHTVVTVTVETSTREIVVGVRDQGVGIDPDRMKSLFKPLEICGDLNHHSEGHGLGLALAQEAIKVHGGRLLVRSDGVDQGTLVRIQLPRQVPEELREHFSKYQYALGKAPEPCSPTQQPTPA